MILTHHLAEAAWPQAIGQRPRGLAFKQAGHRLPRRAMARPDRNRGQTLRRIAILPPAKSALKVMIH